MLRLCAAHRSVYRAGEHLGDFAHQLDTESQESFTPIYPKKYLKVLSDVLGKERLIHIECICFYS